MSASDYKQTCGKVRQSVRVAPESGRKWLWCGMSAFDPKRTLLTFPAEPQESHTQRVLTSSSHELPYFSISYWEPSAVPILNVTNMSPREPGFLALECPQTAAGEPCADTWYPKCRQPLIERQ